MRLLLVFSVLLFSLMAHATVYKWVDKDGNIHYSDKAVGESEPIRFKSNTQNQIKLPQVKGLPEAQLDTDAASIQYKIRITSPAEEATLRNDNGNITVIASITPDLAKNHVLVILVDGKVTGDPQSTPIFSLKNLNRGEHTLEIKAVAQNGKQVATTSTRTIYVHRPSINQFKRAVPLTRGN